MAPFSLFGLPSFYQRPETDAWRWLFEHRFSAANGRK